MIMSPLPSIDHTTLGIESHSSQIIGNSSKNSKVAAARKRKEVKFLVFIVSVVNILTGANIVKFAKKYHDRTSWMLKPVCRLPQ